MAIRKPLRTSQQAEIATPPAGLGKTSTDPRFKVKKHVNAAAWTWVDNVEKLFRIEDRIHKGKTFESKDGKKRAGAYDQPAEVVTVTDLGEATETTRVLVLGKVIKDILEEQYPGDTYVGKCFSVTRLPKAQGKRYHLYTADEIEPV